MIRALALSLLAFAGDPQVESDSKDILRDDRYWFCDVEDDGAISWDARAWCDHADRMRERCPGFVAACERDALDGLDRLVVEPQDGDGVEKSNKQRRFARDGGRSRARDDEPERELEIPAWVRQLAGVLFWVVVGIAVLLAIYGIARSLGWGRRAEDEEAAPPAPPTGDEDAKVVAARAVETDVERLLARARAAASRGEWEAAIADVHAALLRRLEGDGHIEVHPSRTNGDYLRALRSRPDLWGPVAEIVSEVERVQFSNEPATQGGFEGLWSRVTRLLGRGSSTLVLCLLAALTACPGTLREDPVRAEEAKRSKQLAGLGDGPDGVRAVGELLWRNGVEVRHRLTPVGREPLGEAILVVGNVQLEDDEWTTLLDAVEGGATLFVAVAGGLPEELELGVVSDAAVLEPRFVTDEYGISYQRSTATLQPVGDWATTLEGLDVQVPIRRHLQHRTQTRVQTTLLTREDKPYAVQQTLGSGRVIVFADDLLWTNASLAAYDDGTALVRILRNGYPVFASLDVITFTTGSGADDPFESIANTRLLPILFQLFLLIALFYLARGIPFATPRDPPRASRRAFAEHAEALADNYARVRASGFALSLYAAFVLERLRERVGRGTSGLWGLAEAVAARTGGDPQHVMTVLVEAHEARTALERGGDAGKGTSPDQHLNLMRELTRLLVAVTRSKNTP
jgi:hypothetical protein